MRYVFNSDNPVGHRLLSAASSSSGAPIDPCKMYNVVTTNYLADGGDGYNLIAAAHTLEAHGAAQDQVVIDTVKARSPVRGGRGAGVGREGPIWLRPLRRATFKKRFKDVKKR